MAKKSILQTGIILKKKVSLLNKELSINYLNAFKSLAKGLVYAKLGQPEKATFEGLNILAEVKIKDTPEDLLYALVIHSALDAIKELTRENSHKIPFDSSVDHEQWIEQEDYKEFLESAIVEKLENEEFEIKPAFFENPLGLPFLVVFRGIVKSWLNHLQVKETDQDAIVNRFDSYFVYALHNSWRKHKEKFQVIESELITPFTGATQKEDEWRTYNSWLEKQIDTPVFDESFSLKQIYIPLRAYFEEKKDCYKQKENDEQIQENQEKQRVAVELNTTILNWIKAESKKENCIKIISGGPGSGKSSFAKLLAAELAKSKIIKTIFIPLHLFNVKDDLSEAVHAFLKETGHFSFNPIDDIVKGDERILLIFDGLDELSKQGKSGAEATNLFIDEINRKVNALNSQKTKCLVLITGREVKIQMHQSQFRASEQVYHVLPYYIERGDYGKFVKGQSLLQLDQRNEWWTKFGELKGLSYAKMPDELKGRELDEITSQPLLNFLVALSKERGQIKFDEATNLNDIYEDLILGVFERRYEEQHKSTADLKQTEFIRVLEEIAISAWHSGDVRTTSVDQINAHIKLAGLERLVDKFKEDAKSGVMRLLTAFYFRKHDGETSGDQTFEFTHKSFGEYLVGTRIVGLLTQLTKGLNENKADFQNGFDITECLRRWGQVMSLATIDEYIRAFILREIRRYNLEDVKKWQETIILMIEHQLKSGPYLDIRNLSIKETILYSKNYEGNLFVLLNCCSSITQVISDIRWSAASEFGETLSRLVPDRIPQTQNLFLDSLSYLNLEGCKIFLKDLYKANFFNCNLTNTEFSGCFLISANFKNCVTNQTQFVYCNLENANFLNSLSNIEIINCIFSFKHTKTGSLKDFRKYIRKGYFKYTTIP